MKTDVHGYASLGLASLSDLNEAAEACSQLIVRGTSQSVAGVVSEHAATRARMNSR